jgi:hypothetical protein
MFMLVREHLRLQFLQRRHIMLFVVTYFSPLYSLAVTAHAATWALLLGSFTLPECGPARDKHHYGALHLSNTFSAVASFFCQTRISLHLQVHLTPCETT